MTYTVCSVRCGGDGPKLPTLEKHLTILDNRDNHDTPCQGYQYLLHDSETDILIYIHDDVEILDPSWIASVLAPFSLRPDCVAVGFGGATGLGNWNLHRQPYALRNMARSGYASNQTDAEVHGERFTGERRVAVLDAFCMAVRRDYLMSVGGWPTEHLTHHCLDLWLACQAARDGKKIWMTGVSVTHHGGGSSTKGLYQDAPWLQGGSTKQDHGLPHKWLFETYRDVLPIQV